MLMALQIHSFASEGNAFHLQTETLFRCSFKPEFDLTSGADDTLPWKPIGWFGMEELSHGAVVVRISGSRRYLAVGGYFSFGNRKDDTSESCVTQFSTSRAADHHTNFSPS